MTQSNSHQPKSESETYEPGQLLIDLERRQDDVLEQLDELDAKLKGVLKGLGATLDGEEDADVANDAIPRAA